MPASVLINKEDNKMTLTEKANRAFNRYEDYEKERDGWYTGAQCSYSERLHTIAINAAYKAHDNGVSCIELDYFE